MMNSGISIAVLMTCFNRKDKTIACLKSLYDQESLEYNLEISIFLVDDGSSDGTSQKISNEFPDVNIISSSGNLYWAGGMRLAWEKAIESEKKIDFFFLLNDDTLLFGKSLATMINDFRSLPTDEAIIVGTTIDQMSKNISYGGRFLLNNYNISFKTLIPNSITPLLCHLGNANAMLIPISVYNNIGGLSQRYTHGIADYDYTLRAKKYGIASFISTVVVGECQDDHIPVWKEKLTLKVRIKYLYSVKGLAMHEYLYFIRQHFPLYLPQIWIQLWLKTLLPQIWRILKKE